MPELPEVETIRMQLNQALKGLKIADVEILKEKSFQGNKKEVISQKVVGVQRRAKIILIKLENGKYLAIHLKLTGQLIYRKVNQSGKAGQVDQGNGSYAVRELPNKYTRVIISFSDGSKLFFNDLRIFGWVKIVKSSKLKVQSEFERFGPEANDEKKFTLEYFQQILSKSKKPVKLVIMDQEKLAGVGNIYANETLFIAGIDPRRPANTIKESEIRILRDSILRVLKKAIEYKGTSDKDEAYRQISGEKGNFQNYLQVYGKAGQKCPKCGRIISKIKIGGRGTFFCPVCQK